MKRCVSREEDGTVEVVCTDRCGWSAPLAEFDLDEEGNYVPPLECTDCDDGYTYLPESSGAARWST